MQPDRRSWISRLLVLSALALGALALLGMWGGPAHADEPGGGAAACLPVVTDPSQPAAPMLPDVAAAEAAGHGAAACLTPPGTAETAPAATPALSTPPVTPEADVTPVASETASPTDQTTADVPPGTDVVADPAIVTPVSEVALLPPEPAPASAPAPAPVPALIDPAPVVAPALVDPAPVVAPAVVPDALTPGAVLPGPVILAVVIPDALTPDPLVANALAPGAPVDPVVPTATPPDGVGPPECTAGPSAVAGVSDAGSGERHSSERIRMTPAPSSGASSAAATATGGAPEPAVTPPPAAPRPLPPTFPPPFPVPVPMPAPVPAGSSALTSSGSNSYGASETHHVDGPYAYLVSGVSTDPAPGSGRAGDAFVGNVVGGADDPGVRPG